MVGPHDILFLMVRFFHFCTRRQALQAWQHCQHCIGCATAPKKTTGAASELVRCTKGVLQKWRPKTLEIWKEYCDVYITCQKKWKPKALSLENLKWISEEMTKTLAYPTRNLSEAPHGHRIGAVRGFQKPLEEVENLTPIKRKNFQIFIHFRCSTSALRPFRLRSGCRTASFAEATRDL